MRLDHLLSKEHHANVWALGPDEAVKGSRAVVAWGWVRNKHAGRGEPFGVRSREPPGTLLGFEATCPVGGVVPHRFWWWGVVFELWIVVASI